MIVTNVVLADNNNNNTSAIILIVRIISHNYKLQEAIIYNLIINDDILSYIYINL